MSRIPTPTTISDVPAAAQPALEAVKKQLGVVPNLFRLVANSPAALQGYLGLSGAVAKGSLDAKTRERIALAVAGVNGCDYCTSAHSYLGANLAKLDEAELAANRHGRSNDAKADAALVFATRIVQTRGKVSDAELDAVRGAGFSDAQVIEIIVNVALNVLTNFVNNVADTEIDFPVVRSEAA